MKPDYRLRIEALNAPINAFVDFTQEQPGDGLVWAAKSNIAVQGLPLTAGCEAYRTRIAEKDAEIIQRIRASGGSVLGTVNMHEGALGATTDNEAYGRTRNPWNSDYTPGGSSGGSGAAVAAGLCDVALGTDTMGSVRIPAAYCGVQGHKPTYGLVPETDIVPLSTTLDHVGPLARDVATLWGAMHVLAAWGPAPDLQTTPVSGLRIGVWDGGENIALTTSVRTGFEAVLESLREAGATLLPISPPVYEYSRSRRAGLLVSEVEGAKEHRVTADGPRPNGLSDTFYRLLHWGVCQSKEKVDAAYAHIASVHEAAAQVWQSVDFVIAPTAPQEAFRFTDEVPVNQADFTAWADFAKLPATALYAGLTPDRLPLSVQLIGPEGLDQDVLKAAAALETLLGKPPMPPGFEW